MLTGYFKANQAYSDCKGGIKHRAKRAPN